MDSDTPFWALVALSSVWMFAVVGTLLVEVIVGRKYPPLDRLNAVRPEGAAWWWGALLLFIFGIVVAGLQVVFVAALLDPKVAPLTKLIAAAELVLFVGWIAAMIRFAWGHASVD